jgi:hypothetical protein
MTEQEFWDKIIITENEKKKSLHYLQYRGIEEHERIRLILESYTGAKITYSSIASTMRYDKRIRRILYKYIGFIEESTRAYISNTFADSISGFFHTKKLDECLLENYSLFNALCALTFWQLISQVKKMDEKNKIEMFPYYKDNISWLDNDLSALVKLRNEVSHNRFLIDNKRLAFCHVGDKNSSLWANIINLQNCLPEYLQLSFKNEINNSQYNENNNYDNQTDWNLIDKLIINI